MNRNSTTLLVLAAGMGSRFGGLKQLASFGPNGETLMDYTIYDAISVGFNKIIFVIKEEIEEDFKKIFLDKLLLQDKVEVSYVFQSLDNLPKGFDVPKGRIKPWGTGHAVFAASELIKEPFAIVNADDFYGRSSFELMYQHLSKIEADELHACLVGYVLENTLSENGHVSRGICEVAEEGYLKKIEERTKIFKGISGPYYEESETKMPLTGKELVSMNLIGFTPKIFALIHEEFTSFLKKNNITKGVNEEFYIPSVLDKLRRLGHVIPVLETSEVWFGVTYGEDKVNTINQLNLLIDQGVYPTQLWK